MTSPDSVTRKALGSIKWSALMELVSRTAPSLIFVILARLLTPEDYGVVATAMIAISFSGMLWEAGLGMALIQTQEAPEKAANVVFWTNLLLGLLACSLLLLGAPWIAAFFKSPASQSVLRVLSLQVVIGSLTSVQQALMVRDLGFRQLFRIKLVTAFGPGLCSVPLAYSGYGVWALVASYLTGSLLNLALLWSLSPWRPRLAFDWGLARKLYRFGGWVVLDSLVGWVFAWGDSFIVASFLSLTDLGVYRVGVIISNLFFSMALNPFLPVLYPAFSRLQDDPQALLAAFKKVLRVVISLTLPIGVGLLLVGPQLVSVLFGDKWQGLGLTLGILALGTGLSWPVCINNELYRAIGRPDINARLGLTLLFVLPAYLVAVKYGLEVFVLNRLGLTLVTIPIHVYLCMRILGMSRLYLWHEGKPMILASLTMAGTLALLKSALRLSHHNPDTLWGLALLIMAGAAAYGGTLWLLDRPFVKSTINLVNRMFFPFNPAI